MKWLNYLLAVLAFATSGVSHADWISGGTFGTEGELVLTVWNQENFTSFTQDLGVGSSAFLDSSAGYHNFQLSEEGLAYIDAAANPSAIRWNVFGVNTKINGIAEISKLGYYFSSNTMPTNNTIPINTYFAYLQVVEQYKNQLGTPDAGSIDNPVYFLLGATNFAGFQPVWGRSYNTLGNIFGSQDNEAGDGEMQYAWNIGRSQYQPYPVTQATFNGIATFWQLDIPSGSLQYVVPVPAAAWLFVSAMLGFFAFVRRRKAKC